MLYRSEEHKRALMLIDELNAQIKREQEIMQATPSNDRKTGCEMRINMAIWGINLCRHIIK